VKEQAVGEKTEQATGKDLRDTDLVSAVSQAVEWIEDKRKLKVRKVV
jgi:hypothetical protein